MLKSPPQTYPIKACCTISLVMPDIGRTETLVRVPDNSDKLDIFSPLEVPTDMVDSISPPHTAEYISAQHALARDCATLQVIDEDIKECQMRIARAHTQIRLLERQRHAVQHRMSIHRARLSPLRTVPDQVLQEIFRHCLPDAPYIVPSTRSAPLVLTQVCRRWRAVAQGSSELWSSIALHDRGVWNYELDVEMVKQWLDRSYARPIRMSITCPPCTDFGLQRNASGSDLFQVAIAHSSHLSDLCLNVNKTYLQHFMNYASLPALRSIIISLHSIQRIDEPLESTTPALISAPHLRHVALKGNGTSIRLIPRTLFPQISHLSFDCSLTLDPALLFQDFPNLQHLTLTLSLTRDALSFPLPPQRHHKILGPSLLSLEVCLDEDMLDFGDLTAWETLLDQLELPVLRALSIATPLGARYDERTGRTEEAGWENHMAWVRSPSVCALLARSRYARLEHRDLCVHGGQGRWYEGI